MATGLTPQRLMRIAQRASRCHSEEAFENLVVDEVRPCLPHRQLVAAIGIIELEHIAIGRLIGVGHTPDVLRTFPLRLNLSERPVVARWLRTRSPCVIELPRDAHWTSHREQQEIQQLDLGRMAIHGLLDLPGCSGTYFSFSQLDPDVTEDRASEVLKLMLPHLHQALLQLHLVAAAASPVEGNEERLTDLELELLKWLAVGRTNAEIARLRGRSEATVRNQIHRIFAKLGVSNRAEAALAYQRLSRFQPQWHRVGK